MKEYQRAAEVDGPTALTSMLAPPRTHAKRASKYSSIKYCDQSPVRDLRHDLDLGDTPGLSMASNLRRAIADRELTLHYQPQFNLESGLACGMEALSRWFPAGEEAIEPAVFISLAEHTLQIGALGQWALEDACKTARGFCTSKGVSLQLCVNVSPLQLSADLMASIEAILVRTGFPAAQLELEITERVLLPNCPSTIACLLDLKSMGLRIAIDDFGIGYANLGYLASFPIDRVKLDKSLTQHLKTEWKSVAVLRSIISLCKALHITVIAEGIETEQELDTLQLLGCEQGQGYLLGRPAGIAATRMTMDRRWGDRPKLHPDLVPAETANEH